MTRNVNGSTTRRSVLAGSLSFAATPFVLKRRAAAQSETLYVNSWGGNWTDAETTAFYRPFTEATGINVRAVTPMSIAKSKLQVQRGSYDWDLASGGEMDLKQGELQGFLEPVDRSIVKPDGLSEISQFGVGYCSFSTLLTFRKDKFPTGGPQSWADFWNVAKFPGTRGLENTYTNVTFALLADGVPKDKLFPLDLDRAYKKLDQIKPHIKVWWTQGAQSEQLAKDGELDMMSIWSGRGQILIDQGVPLQLVWNGGQNDFNYWFVLKGTPRAKLAWKFIAFAAQAKPNADFCNRLPYGPANQEAFKYIPPERARVMPTYPQNYAEQFRVNADYLGPRVGELKERWTRWLAS
jgi:putative spermidine/putrescine transport system substrate-binding protein